MCDIGFVPLGQKITRAMSHVDRGDSSPKRRSMCDIGFVPLGQKITRSHVDRFDSSVDARHRLCSSWPENHKSDVARQSECRTSTEVIRRSMCDIRTRFGGVKSTSNSHAIFTEG
jgi:hypothetical protein